MQYGKRKYDNAETGGTGTEIHPPQLNAKGGKNSVGDNEFRISNGTDTILKVSTKKETDDFITASKSKETAQQYVNNVTMRWTKAIQKRNSLLSNKLKNMSEAMKELIKKM